MSARSEYQRNYRKTHPRKKYFKEKYEEDKDDRLTYQRNYDRLHREERMFKLQTLEPGALIDGIFKCVHKYANKWVIPCDCYQDILNWSIDDPTFTKLYDEWKYSGYDRFLRPVLMRDVKKKGFVKGNIHWDIKKNFSWWNEDSELYKEVEKETEDVQRVNNKRGKEWNKKVYKDFKAKKKAKEKK